jgi:antitoxin (DNA-binding transcriptional repressor) of toxin-antitoxin stability system
VKTATVGEVQKNFSRVLKEIKAGEEIIVTKRGKPVARIRAMGPKNAIDWPDFSGEAIEVKGTPLSDIVIEEREDRF